MASILIVEGKLSSGKYTYAGKEKMVQWLGNNLAKYGHSVTFCTVYDKVKSERMSALTDFIPLEIEFRNSFWNRNLTFFLQFPSKIRTVLRKKRYDYVVSFGDTSLFILAFLKKIYKFKLVVSERSDPFYNRTRLDKIKRKLYNKADIVVFQTKGAQEYFTNKIKKKSVIIPNPISIPNEEWHRDGSLKMIANVGRIDLFQKRQDVLVKSFALVHKKYPEYILNIYGSGNDESKLIEIIHNLELDNAVILHGQVDNVRLHLLKNEIFILTSDFEGIPNALLEAMALGMPVVSTDCSPGGAAMLINDGENGLLVPVRDVNAIAQAIARLIENHHAEIVLGKNARGSMVSFSEGNIINSWLKIFE